MSHIIITLSLFRALSLNCEHMSFGALTEMTIFFLGRTVLSVEWETGNGRQQKQKYFYFIWAKKKKINEKNENE